MTRRCRHVAFAKRIEKRRVILPYARVGAVSVPDCQYRAGKGAHPEVLTLIAGCRPAPLSGDRSIVTARLAADGTCRCHGANGEARLAQGNLASRAADQRERTMLAATPVGPSEFCTAMRIV